MASCDAAVASDMNHNRLRKAEYSQKYKLQTDIWLGSDEVEGWKDVSPERRYSRIVPLKHIKSKRTANRTGTQMDVSDHERVHWLPREVVEDTAAGRTCHIQA